MIITKSYKLLRKLIFGNKREKVLIKIFYKIIKSNSNSKKISILDFGSGFQPYVIIHLQKMFQENDYETEITCVDLYSDDELIELNKKNPLINFLKVKDLNYELKYDFSIISDVLHHMDIENKKLIKKTLVDLGNLSNVVIVKDHFNSNKVDRLLLRIMDYFGNSFNKVYIPERYFGEDEFELLVHECELEVESRIRNVRLYQWYILFFNNPKYQFIYTLKKVYTAM
jgi:hypothetical protein